jgi:ABC-type lipoprotein release transport system permease subunit
MPERRFKRLFDLLARDIRYALRRLGKNPGFTATAILSLAIGIGGSTAMFSVVNAVMARRPTFAAPEELLAVFQSEPGAEWDLFSYPDYRDLRDGTEEVFSGLVSTRPILTQGDHGDAKEMIFGEAVSGNFFTLLGIDAHVGRTLLPSDGVSPGAHPVVVLGYKFWMSEYGGDEGAVGSQIRLAGRPYTIVGVASREYPGSLTAIAPVFYAPVMMVNELQPSTSDQLEDRGNHGTWVTGRLRPGVGPAQVQAAVDRVADDLRRLELENRDPDAGFRVVPKDEIIFFPPIDPLFRAAGWLLMVVVTLVLVMATTNLASFLLARTLDRRKEIAVRLALGARRGTVARQLVVETMLLGLVGGIAGSFLAWLLLRLPTMVDVPLPVPIDLDVGLDQTVLSFTFVISMVAGLFLGMAPVLQNMGMDMAATIRAEGAGGGSAGKLRLRNALVVAQVAISLFLLLGAGLFVRSLARMGAVDPGFFSAVGIRILEGRVFDDGDRHDSQPVTIVSEAMARRFWPDRRAVGQMVRRSDAAPALRVIGVAKDTKVRSLGEEPRAFIYVPLSQDYTTYLTAVARTRLAADRTALDLVEAARDVDPDLPVWNARTMSEHLSTQLLAARLSAAVLSAFAAVALTLVVIGLYGVVGYAAARRRREVGIRLSLGATGSAVIRLLMSTGLRLVLIGGVIGIGVTLLASRLVAGLLFEVSPADPLTFAAVLVMLVVVTAVSTFFPAWTASRIDPAKTLRAE